VPSRSILSATTRNRSGKSSVMSNISYMLTVAPSMATPIVGAATPRRTNLV
jgi:hypothetical protein